MDTPVDISAIRLETARLVLRPWKETDLADFYEYASVEGVGEMAGWRHHTSLDESRRILNSFIAEKNVFAVTDRKTGKVIGSLGLHPSWANREAAYAPLKIKELGYVLSRDYWGQGLMPEAVREVLRFCFEDLGLDGVSISHFRENRQSRRVIEKCGFRFIQNGEYYAGPLNKTFEDCRYLLLREEFRG